MVKKLNSHWISEMSFVLIASVFSGCGSGLTNDISGTHLPPVSVVPPPVGFPDSSGVIVKSRSTFDISTQGQTPSQLNILAIDGTQPINVTNAPSSSMILSNSAFKIPVITSQLLDFGYLQITALSDNNLSVCGTTGNQPCTTALVRMYTIGTSGPGLFNSAGGYGAPIEAGPSLVSVGLNTTGAATIQSISIPNTKHVVHLADFANPKYDIKIDFSNAGAGVYSTTLVVEYALAP